jgi:putative endonuclease
VLASFPSIAARRPSRDPRRPLGRHGEAIAAAHLRALGFQIVARNVRTRAGEIDVIAYGGGTLVFAEVKTRRVRDGMRLGHEPLEALRPRQRARLRRLAVSWLASTKGSRPRAHRIRFDAIGVLVDARGALRRLEHLEGAW